MEGQLSSSKVRHRVYCLDWQYDTWLSSITVYWASPETLREDAASCNLLLLLGCLVGDIVSCFSVQQPLFRPGCLCY